jgi:ankyrin repeat protein
MDIYELIKNGDLNGLKTLNPDLNIDHLLNASKFGKLDIVKFLINGWRMNPSEKNTRGSTALHFAAEFGHLHVIKYLIHDCNVNPNIKSGFNESNALYITVAFGYLDVAKYLIHDCNVDPHIETTNGDNTLDAAKFSCDLTVFFYLIKLGVSSKKTFNRKIYPRLVLNSLGCINIYRN